MTPDNARLCIDGLKTQTQEGLLKYQKAIIWLIIKMTSRGLLWQVLKMDKGRWQITNKEIRNMHRN